ncbi:MAG: cytochrome c oxidase subunit II [Dehalococcoidia bacterium]|nr:cytochrome c oxidase subunit II [Dehalococcoidia bacterium]
MRRDFTLFTIVWALVTAASLAVAYFILRDMSFPTHGAEEASVIDDAFMALTYLACPVFGIVIAAMVVALLKHRSSGPNNGDGERILGTGSLPVVWFGVSSLLCAIVIIYPGLTGLFELRDHKDPDLRIVATAQMWAWTVEYPDSKVKVFGAQELVLPKDETVEVDITSIDILHSFWVPAFRQKMDAVPGQINKIYITPDRVGDRESDAAYRLQCAELCGLGHAIMTMPVRVVEKAEFDAWLKQQQSVTEAK